ncbi:MAG: T9SS type A sorting domain-containing protein [Bacteroidota bacterium]
MSIRTLAAVVLAAFAIVPLSAQTLYEQPASGIAAGSGQSLPDSENGWLYSEDYVAVDAAQTQRVDSLDSYLADDFTVPASQDWSVTSISVVGFYVSHNGVIEPSEAFDVIFWSDDDANGKPDQEIYRADNVVPTSDDAGYLLSGTIVLPLDTPAALEAGKTYWITVQAQSKLFFRDTSSQTFLEGTRFLWLFSATAISEPLQLWNYGEGLYASFPCTQDWGDNTPECGSVNRINNEPTLYFLLEGSSIPVASEEATQSQTVSILPTRPNPAAGRTLIPFTLRQPADVRLAVYDVLGREVALVTDGSYSAGTHAEPLDTSGFAPGTYVVRLAAGPDVVLRTISVAR